jgi:hypothetical protein
VISILRSSIIACCAILVSVAAIPISSTGVEAAGTRCLPGALKSRLDQIRAQFGPVRIVSTYRRGARIAGSGKRSFHASCRAVDFVPPRGKYGQVANWLKQVHGGGVGTYSCGMHHIHLDNGPRIRFHKCTGRADAGSWQSLRQAASRARSVSRAVAPPRAPATLMANRRERGGPAS